MQKRSEWSRRFGPLPGLAIAMLLVVLVLPSALNVPLSNPSTTPEFAPVPPQDKKNPPPVAGNFAGVGFSTGTGNYGPLAPTLPGLPPPGRLTAVGKDPSTKLCVGNPPRQTEDPLSPPCVAYFKGDNGGATYPGVTATEVRILVYSDGDFQYDGCNDNNPPVPRYYDLFKPPDASENTCVTRVFRAYQQYFNNRYQLYGRRAHFFVYFSAIDGTGDIAAERRADAADNFTRVHPFAVVPAVDANGFQDAYIDAIARKGVTYFTDADFRSQSYFQKYAGLLWGYLPSLEQKADQYAGYICNQIAPFPVTFSGNGDQGKKRVYGLLETTDAARPELRRFQDLVKAKVQRCGITFAHTEYYPKDHYLSYSGSADYATYATPGMANMQRAGVTTLVWPAGYENQYSHAAGELRYYPEWVTGGDDVMDGYTMGLAQDQTVWSHAVNVTNRVHSVTIQGKSGACAEAYTEAAGPPDPSSSDPYYACVWYDSLRQLFTGIQVAGPKLTPTRLDQGYHAIPPHPSTDAASPSCYYAFHDYTCVKDAMSTYWDPTKQDAGNAAGCWRVISGGRRYTADRWPRKNTFSLRTSSDVCDGWSGSGYIGVQGPPS